jgi:hypothetical protein
VLTVSPAAPRVAQDVDLPSGTVGVPVVAGTATTTSTLPRQAGEVTVSADYLGSSAARPAGASTVLRVAAQTPSLTVTAPARVRSGAPFTVRAAISGPVDVPEGDVQLIAHRPGVGLVVVNATLRDGQVTAEMPGLDEGQWRFLAHYSGSSTQGQYEQVDAAELDLEVVAPPVPVAVTVPTEVRTPVGTPATLVLDLPARPRPTPVTVLAGDEVLVTAPVPATGLVTVVLPLARRARGP